MILSFPLIDVVNVSPYLCVWWGSDVAGRWFACCDSGRSFMSWLWRGWLFNLICMYLEGEFKRLMLGSRRERSQNKQRRLSLQSDAETLYALTLIQLKLNYTLPKTFLAPTKLSWHLLILWILHPISCVSWRYDLAGLWFVYCDCGRSSYHLVMKLFVAYLRLSLINFNI